VWNSVEEIDWNSLSDQFVIKCTHDSGGLIICKDKSQLNKEKAIAKLEKCMKSDYYKRYREWPYKNVERKIIAEKYMTDNSNSSQLTDYKVYTFNGRAKMIMINKDRGVNTKADYFDTNFQCLDFSWGYPHVEVKPQKPKCLDEMIELGEKQYDCNFELGKQAAKVCDYIILVGKKQTKPIYDGIVKMKFNKEKIQIVEDVQDAIRIAKGLKAGKKRRIILLENDLPDNY
jgi:hypothetical protein